MVFYLALYMSSLSASSSSTMGEKTGMSIFSQNAITYGSDVFLLSETKGSGGIGWGDLGLVIE
jgi:hypothetical protein